MSAQHRSSLSPAAGSKPATVEEAWRRHYKFSAAGSRRAACKYVGSEWMPPTLRDFTEGGRYHKVNPSLKPMSGGDFDKAQADAEEAAQAIAAVKELMAREAAATTPLIILDN
jgi:hypothetical protein